MIEKLPARLASALTRTFFSAVLASPILSGCLREAPGTEVVDWAPECEGTEPGNACLMLHFFTTDSVRRNPPGDLVGVVHWSMYKAGDVGLFGPGDSPKLYEGQTDDQMDLSRAESAYDLHISNVPARSYQVLSYLDDNMDGDATDGDPVTFPSDGFLVHGDVKNIINVGLDYIR